MNNNAIKSGLIIGVISIIVTLLMYLIDPTLLASMWAGLIIFVIIISLVAYFGIQNRNEEGGFMTFGSAWIYSMKVFVIAGIIGTIFRVLLFNAIDPELTEIVVDAAVENTEAMMQNFGAPEETMEQGIEDARVRTEESLTVMGNIKGFAWGLIFYALFSLITGAIIKKNEPEFEG